MLLPVTVNTSPNVCLLSQAESYGLNYPTGPTWSMARKLSAKNLNYADSLEVWQR